MTKLLELQLQHQSFQWLFRTDFLYDWLVWPPCSPRDLQESSLAPQFKGINSLALSLFYCPALTSVHDYCKNRSFSYTDICWQSNISAFNTLSTFVMAFLPRSNHLLVSELQSPSAVILEPKKIKSVSFLFSPFYLPSSDGTGCHDLGFLNVEFRAIFFTLLFHPYQEAL